MDDELDGPRRIGIISQRGTDGRQQHEATYRDTSNSPLHHVYSLLSRKAAFIPARSGGLALILSSEAF
jgi:hypothetical protein